MKEFRLYGEVLQFTDQECAFRNVDITYKQYADKALEEFAGYYDSIRNGSNFLEQFMKDQKLFNVLGFYIDILLKELIDWKIYDYNEERILSTYPSLIFAPWEETYSKLVDSCASVLLTKEQEVQYREYRKAGRGKWVGGGFGLGGALSGAMKAGAMNAVTGTFHSIGNTIGNAYSHSQAQRKIRQLASQYRGQLLSGFYQAIRNLEYVYIDILSRNSQMDAKVYSKAEIEQHRTVLDNLPHVQDTEEQKRILREEVKRYPYEEHQYQLMLQSFGDESGEVEAVGEYFGIGIAEMKMRMVEEAVGDIDFNDEGSMLAAKKRLSEIGGKLGWRHADKEQEIQRGLDTYDLKCRTVPDISSDYSPSVDYKVRSKLITAEGIVFQSREEAEAAKKSRGQIEKIYEGVDFSSEESMQSALEGVKGISGKDLIGRRIAEELQQRITDFDRVCRTVLGTEYETREEAAQERKKVVGNVKFSSAEEAGQVREDLKKIDGIKRSENPDMTINGEVKVLKSLKESVFLTKHAYEVVASEEAALVQKYHALKKDMDNIPVARRAFRMWSLLSIISIFIGIILCLGILRGWWRIVAVLIVGAVIMEAKEKKEDLGRCKDSREKFMELQRVVQIEDGKVVIR